jgi:hypothetical protein
MKNILSSLTNNEKNRILEMHKKATSKFYLFENTLPTDIKWQSCDGNLNTLSSESISFLTPSGEENGKKLYKFTKTPEDKAGTYDVKGCVCEDTCVTEDESFYIEEGEGTNILRLYEGF